jgi:hypothetical protein
MSELDDLPEATAENWRELKRKLRSMVADRPETEFRAEAEAYRMWIEAERDRRELEEADE